jgi:hypothetical protein
MKHEQDARTKELSNLRLALATFALQLDAFEMRVRAARFKTGGTNEPVSITPSKQVHLGKFEVGTERASRGARRLPFPGK